MDDKHPVGSEFFVRQLMLHRKRIYAFILTLVGNTADAEDIMQETAVVMWEKYSQTEAIENFASLGMRIAHFKVLEFRKQQYQKRLQFDSTLFDRILGGAVAADEKVDERFEAIKHCLSKLDATSRMLVEKRHQKGQTIKRIAASVKMSRHAAYKRIARLHDQLVQCVRRTLRQEGVF